MRPKKSFVIRVVVYSAVLLYLAADLFWFHGPVMREIESVRPDSPQSLERAKARGMVAQVFGHPIYLSQVEREARMRVWLRGKTLVDLTTEQRRLERLAALNELIDHQLLRVKVLHNSDELPVSDAEIDAAVKGLASRFASRDEMQKELAAEGIDSEKELRLRLGARLQQEKYLESRIAEGIKVGEDEAREWFEASAERFKVPERVHARHVFLATLERPSDEAKAALEKALEELKGGKSFAALALELSEDERNKRAGGDLGWLTRERLPAELAGPLFEMAIDEPKLVRSKIGWHFIEVLEKRPAETRSFEEAHDEVMAALEGAKRREMVRRFREKLRATEKIAIHVFPEMVTGEL